MSLVKHELCEPICKVVSNYFTYYNTEVHNMIYYTTVLYDVILLMFCLFSCRQTTTTTTSTSAALYRCSFQSLWKLVIANSENPEKVTLLCSNNIWKVHENNLNVYFIWLEKWVEPTGSGFASGSLSGNSSTVTKTTLKLSGL